MASDLLPGRVTDPVVDDLKIISIQLPILEKLLSGTLPPKENSQESSRFGIFRIFTPGNFPLPKSKPYPILNPIPNPKRFQFRH